MNARDTRKINDACHRHDIHLFIAREEIFAGIADRHRRSLLSLQRHDDLAEMLVGIHVRERLADVVEGKHLVDRQLQLA